MNEITIRVLHDYNEQMSMYVIYLDGKPVETSDWDSASAIKFLLTQKIEDL